MTDQNCTIYNSYELRMALEQNRIASDVYWRSEGTDINRDFGQIPTLIETEAAHPIRRLFTTSLSVSAVKALKLPNLEYLCCPDYGVEYYETVDRDEVERIANALLEREHPCYVYIGRYQNQLEQILYQKASAEFLEDYNALKEKSYIPEAVLDRLVEDRAKYKDSDYKRFFKNFRHYELGNTYDHERYKAKAIKKGVWLEPDILPEPMPEIQNSTENLSQKDLLFKTIARIAKHHDVSEEALAASLELSNLEGIERALQAAKAPRDVKDGEESALKSAHQEFVNHVLIPHLDYFVITAVKTAGNAASVDLRDYPNIQRVVGADYDFASLAKRSTQRITGAANFDYLRDPTQGDHMERLQRALNEVNGVVSGYEGMFRTLEADIAQIYTDIDKNRGLIDEKGRYLVEARKGNEFRTDRIHEYTTRANMLLTSARARNAERAKVSVGRFLLHAPAEMFENLTGIPVRTMIGLPDLGNDISTARATMAAAEQESDAARAVVEYYRSKQIDTDAIEGDIAIAKKGIEKLESNRDLKRLQQDDAKKKAVAEAFVNKLMLSFGKRMSGALQDICEDHGIEHIDDVFGAFEADPRFKEALENLCFGIADSNDLSVIMAEVASFNNETPAHNVLQEFVEGTLKGNIDSLYAHASKVDLIYQANLSRLGTGLHDARHMIRSAYDERVTSLFSDSFGVHSELSDFSVLGATDVKNLFDYYLHRHGKDTLTDTKIHDGKVTGKKAPKRLSVLDDKEVSEHVELAKNYRSYRQQGPDITDMFLRTCGYEYFYPQAPNGAPRTNIMADNPEAPAAYVMANKVLHSFIQKMAMQGIDDYRGKVGEKLDALISESLMDFFSELGRIHAADHKLGEKRGNLKQAAKETGTFGFAFDSYERVITRDALSRFDLFLEIYSANLQKQVRDCPKDVANVLREQVAAIREVNGDMLNPQIVEPGSHEDRHRARVANHSFENTYWRGAS